MKSLLCIILISIPFFLNAQSPERKNSAYFLVLGNGLILSVNYERQISNKPILNFQIGAGLGGAKPNIPLGLNYLLPLYSRHSFMEAGVAGVLAERDMFNGEGSYVGGSPYTVAFVPQIGYRYHGHKGFLFKVHYSPVFVKNKFYFQNAGLAVGWRF
jgi:hypothetical protein